MFKDNHCVFELPFLMAKVLRRLTGIREVPGMLDGKIKGKLMGSVNFASRMKSDCFLIS